LKKIDLTRTTNFTDSGLTSILTAGARVITSLNLSDCGKLNTLAMVGLRSKMICLEALNLSYNSAFSQSAYEWIGEGCKALKSLNLSSSPAFSDSALISIGQNCHSLQKLNISSCLLITDLGIEGFMKEFKGKLLFLDISGNLECTGLTTEYLSAGAGELIEIRMNGIGSILNPGLQVRVRVRGTDRIRVRIRVRVSD
jgi:F-box/leucine-rich repeat protein 2/20